MKAADVIVPLPYATALWLDDIKADPEAAYEPEAVAEPEAVTEPDTTAVPDAAAAPDPDPAADAEATYELDPWKKIAPDEVVEGAAVAVG
jgi:hypothetical protein